MQRSSIVRSQCLFGLFPESIETSVPCFFFSSFFWPEMEHVPCSNLVDVYTFATNSIIVPVIEGEKGGRTQKKERKKGKSRYLIRYSFFFSPDDYLY